MKFDNRYFVGDSALVAPLAGAWIEIIRGAYIYTLARVAPLAGAWIEMLPRAAIASTP